MQSENSSTLFVGGGLTIIIIGFFCLKALNKLFIQLEITFHSFSNMGVAFIQMAFTVGAALLLGAAILGVLVASGYFTYRYVQIVIKATELKRWVHFEVVNLEGQVGAALTELRTEVRNKMNDVTRELRDALKEPEALPESSPMEFDDVPKLIGGFHSTSENTPPAQDLNVTELDSEVNLNDDAETDAELGTEDEMPVSIQPF